MKTRPFTFVSPSALRCSCTVLSLALLSLGALRAADSDSLVRMGDSEIKISDIQPLLDGLSASDRAALSKNPDSLKQLIRSLVVQKLLLTEATAKHWDQQPSVQEQIARARDNAIAESYLRSVSGAAAGFPTEADIASAYKANKAALLVPRQYRLAQIFIAAPASGDKAAMAKVQARLDLVKASLSQSNADFSALASSTSDDPQAAAHNGEIGWLTEAQIQPEVRAKVGSLPVGGMTEAIKLNDGWHILKVMEIKDAYTASLDDVRSQLAQRLLAARVQANAEAYVTKLLQKYPVEINEIAVSELLNKTSKTTP